MFRNFKSKAKIGSDFESDELDPIYEDIFPEIIFTIISHIHVSFQIRSLKTSPWIYSFHSNEPNDKWSKL
jgi:hypothetical protein